MAYEKIGWVDEESSSFSETSPSLCADNLNKMDNGIAASVRRDGDKMTGALELCREPQTDMEAANKKYVEDNVFGTKKLVASVDASFTESLQPTTSSGMKGGMYFCKNFINSSNPLILTGNLQEVLRFTPNIMSGTVFLYVRGYRPSGWSGYEMEHILYEDDKELKRWDSATQTGSYALGVSESIEVKPGKTYTVKSRRTTNLNTDNANINIQIAYISGYIIDDYTQYFSFGE